MGRRPSDQPRTTRGVALTSVQYNRCLDAAKLAGKTFSTWAADLLDAHATATLKGGEGTCFRCKSINTRYFSEQTREYVCKLCAETYGLLLQDYRHTKSYSVEETLNRLFDTATELREAIAEQEINAKQKLEKSNRLAHLIGKGVTKAHTEYSSTDTEYTKTSTDLTPDENQNRSESKVYPKTSTDLTQNGRQSGRSSKVYPETSTDLPQNVNQSSRSGKVYPESSTDLARNGKQNSSIDTVLTSNVGQYNSIDTRKSGSSLYPQEAGGMLGALAGPLTTPTEEILARLLSAPAVGDDVDDE